MLICCLRLKNLLISIRNVLIYNLEKGTNRLSVSNFTTDSQLVSRAILEISDAVLSTKNLDELYSEVHKITNQYIPADNFYIALINENTNEIYYPYYVDQTEPRPNSIEIDKSVVNITNYVIEQNSPLLITSKMLKDLIKEGKIKDHTIKFDEWLGTPLKTLDNNTVGLIAVQNKSGTQSFADQHKNFLSFISTQIALAIQNKKYFDKVKENESKFRTFYQKNPLMLFIINENGKVLATNEQTKLDLEYDTDELIGKDVTMVFHPDDVAKVRENIKECLSDTDGHHKWELRKISKSGKVIWVRESARTFHLKDEPVQILITCENITAYKRTELKLRESEEKYKLVTNSIDEMILLHDLDGNISFANQAATALVDYSMDKLLDKNIFSIFPQEYSKQIIDYISDQDKENLLYFFEFDVETGNKKLPLEISVTKINHQNNRDKILLVARDITERKEREENYKKYNEELKKANSEKDKFFSIIAHDLRSPFDALLSYSDILYEEFDELEQSEMKEYFTHMRSVTHNIYALLTNLLEWSRIKTDRYSMSKIIFDVKNTIHSVANLFVGALEEKHIELKIECDNKCFAFADENMISTVIRNILSNAIKFSENNSQILITAERKPECVEVAVEDSGIGMIGEDMGKLFRIDVNHTTLGTNKERGTGLGLILSKEMVVKNGGNIEVESELGKGSKFSFTIPLG